MRVFGYVWQTGAVAWIFHRISGLALTFYLPLHIWVVHHLSEGPEAFDAMMGQVQTPLFRILEIALLAAVLYHSINGFRILLFDLGLAIRAQKKVFWAAMVLTIAALAFGGAAMLSHLIHQG
jgi:succinate dehydrogenase / fumarate reductase, cytochrome b subunit